MWEKLKLIQTGWLITFTIDFAPGSRKDVCTSYVLISCYTNSRFFWGGVVPREIFLLQPQYAELLMSRSASLCVGRTVTWAQFGPHPTPFALWWWCQAIWISMFFTHMFAIVMTMDRRGGHMCILVWRFKLTSGRQRLVWSLEVLTQYRTVFQIVSLVDLFL